jgi:hypothetical protein
VYFLTFFIKHAENLDFFVKKLFKKSEKQFSTHLTGPTKTTTINNII